MTIRDRSEYEAAAARAHALSDAPEGSPQAYELARLIIDLKAWDEEREGGLSHSPEVVDGLTRPDDWTVSGLPGKIGKLRKD